MTSGPCSASLQSTMFDHDRSEPVDAVPIEDLVVADDRQILELRLCRQHPIERIAMAAGKATGALGMKIS